jgi:hypothetical protein
MLVTTTKPVPKTELKITIENLDEFAILWHRFNTPWSSVIKSPSCYVPRCDNIHDKIWEELDGLRAYYDKCQTK